MDWVSVTKRKCMQFPNAMDNHRIKYQWCQLLHHHYPYHFVCVSEYNLPLPDRIWGNNTF